MAHFALIENNIVIRVEAVCDVDCLDENGQENESAGVAFLRNLYNDQNLIFKQTSFNGKIRKNYAGVGYTYDIVRDAFIPPMPEGAFILNEFTCRWEEIIS